MDRYAPFKTLAALLLTAPTSVLAQSHPYILQAQQKPLHITLVLPLAPIKRSQRIEATDEFPSEKSELLSRQNGPVKSSFAPYGSHMALFEYKF